MRLAVITDEVSPELEPALRLCEALGVSTVELRNVGGRNVGEHDHGSLLEIRAALRGGGFDCRVVDSPFLKTEVPNAEWDALERAFDAAHFVGAPTVRVFSGLRTPDPAEVTPWIVDVLTEASERAGRAGLGLALEVEHVCNVATGEEAGRLLERLPDGSLGLVWDPGNEAMFRGGAPDRAGYSGVRERIVHVHVKDASGGEWVRVGSGDVGWADELRGLAESAYDGFLSIETHYELPDGGGAAATEECVRSLRAVAREVGVTLE
jgi:L-ribulose-5-phosphate 3-epimerase